MALTFKQVDAVLARITYKPGWTWRAVNGRSVVLIELRARLIDVRNHAVELEIRHAVPILKRDLPHLGASNVADMLFEAIRMIECHELEEWFRVDRRPYRAPHRSLF